MMNGWIAFAALIFLGLLVALVVIAALTLNQLKKMHCLSEQLLSGMSMAQVRAAEGQRTMAQMMMSAMRPPGAALPGGPMQPPPPPPPPTAMG